MIGKCQFVIRALTLPLMLALAGCAAVYHPVPLGETPARLDPAIWDGLWTEPDIGFVIETVDADAGVLDVLVIDGETTRHSEIRVMQSGGWLFGSTRDYDPETQTAPVDEIPVQEAAPWVFFRIVNQGDTLMLWLPDVKRFRDAVERGTLPGRIQEDDVSTEIYLDTLTPEQQRIITESREGVLLNWEEPIVLRRVIGGKARTGEDAMARDQAAAHPSASWRPARDARE